MPPMVLNPPNNGSTQGTSYNFNPTNAHGTHPATTVFEWKVTVTTGQSNGGTLIAQTAWASQPIVTCVVTGLPKNNTYCWGQIVYRKTNGGSQWVSTSNKFQSQP